MREALHHTNRSLWSSFLSVLYYLCNCPGHVLALKSVILHFDLKKKYLVHLADSNRMRIERRIVRDHFLDARGKTTSSPEAERVLMRKDQSA
jgi:hypothetical protein